MKPRTTAFGLSRGFEIGLLGQLVVGALFAGIAIGELSFWHDEVASTSVAERSFGGIIDVLGDTDSNSGFYYLLLHVWMWGGESEGWVRVLSALCVVATIPVTALLARRLWDDPVGLVAGFLQAGNVFLVIYAQQARGYALALLLSTAATWLYVEAAWRDRLALYAGYAVVSVLAVYASLFSGLVILAHFVALPFFPSIRPLLRRFAATYGAILAGTAPLAVYLAASASDQVSWIERPGLRDLPGTAERLLAADERALAAVIGLLVLIGLVSSWVAIRGGDREPAYARWRLILLSAWLFLPPLLLFGVSLAKPLFIDRYLVSVVPSIAILGAVGLVAAARRSRPLAIGVAAVVVCLSVLGRVHFEPVDDEDLRSAAERVAREGTPSDGIAYVPAFTRVGLNWYLERQPGSDQPEDFAIAPGGRPEGVGDLYAREISAEELVARLRTYPRVWVVEYPDSDWHPTPEPMLDAGLRVLRDEYARVSAEDFDGVLVELYQRRRENGKGPR